ncbi:hypothetical protein TSAR_001225 [Trichomalopsis sarcophagae]|uniref:Odorant receptor n=1 Tax=Trichomalopsis sarcophagae TaxID=543379 RepID=A0A232F4P5_9HYME|nr:hypothetical protein TSAR_001225 [Trichomalopsis sarcophagae]
MHEKLIAIQKTNAEYELLPFQFLLLTIWGIWHPKDWPARLKNISNIIFISVFCLDIIICFEMSIYLVLSIGTNDFKLVNIFLTSATITGIYKAIKTMRIRESFRTMLLNYFNYEHLCSLNTKERMIREKNQTQIRKVTIIYSASMAGIFALNAIAPALSQPDSTMQLPVDAWYPYSIQKSLNFWLTYFHQIILGSSLICVHIGIDTLFVGLLLKLVCQINILRYRLQSLTTLCSENYKNFEHFNAMGRKFIYRYIHHQNKIYEFSKVLNNKFQAVITSIPNLCINVYTLSKYSGIINMDYISIIFNTTSSLIQLFITCWYGNEVLLSSLQIKKSIYEMDWTKLDVPTKKLLIVIMARSLRPIAFSVAHVIPMNIESFIKIIKISYSAFNVLQQT